ncbi:MAG: LPS export ABC transporter permease LptG [Nitratireductor sp.]|nr:LPS export ABC transporter permease LptG [Nitratireductor sp.]
MIGRTLGSYFALRFAKTMLAMMVSLILLIIMIDFVEQVRKAAEASDISMFDLIKLSALKAPIFIDKAFPFACLFAAMITLTQLNNKLELVVVRASGISAWEFLMPIGLTAMVIGLFVALVYNPLAILSFEASKNAEVEIFDRGQRARNAEVAGYWIRQDEPSGSSILNARIARKEGSLLDDVKIIRFDEVGRIVERIDAKRAAYKGDHWRLHDAVSVGEDGRAVQNSTLDIPTKLSRDALVGITASPDSIPVWSLRQTATKALLSGGNPNPYLVQFYSLLALPLFLLAMVLIAATVTLRFVRFGQVGRLIVGGILSGFLLYTITNIVTSLGSNGIVPPPIAAWSPAIVAILFGITILLHQEDG